MVLSELLKAIPTDTDYRKYGDGDNGGKHRLPLGTSRTSVYGYARYPN